jgi:hypothetical protein
MFAQRAAVTFESRQWIKSSRRDKFNFPQSPLKSQKQKEVSQRKTNKKQKQSTIHHPKWLLWSWESSIRAMLLLMAQSRAETPFR